MATTNKPIVGKLTDIGQLVKQQQLVKLTEDNEVKFKIIFNSQLEDKYMFGTLKEVIDSDLKRQLNDQEQLRLYRLFGTCVDTFVNRSITNVEAHFREPDKKDSAYDPVGGGNMQIQHFAVDGDNKFRIHGYFNSNGYFVVTRLDWCHLAHLRKDRKCSQE